MIRKLIEVPAKLMIPPPQRKGRKTIDKTKRKSAAAVKNREWKRQSDERIDCEQVEERDGLGGGAVAAVMGGLQPIQLDSPWTWLKENPTCESESSPDGPRSAWTPPLHSHNQPPPESSDQIEHGRDHTESKYVSPLSRRGWQQRRWRNGAAHYPGKTSTPPRRRSVTALTYSWGFTSSLWRRCRARHFLSDLGNILSPVSPVICCFPRPPPHKHSQKPQQINSLWFVSLFCRLLEKFHFWRRGQVTLIVF